MMVARYSRSGAMLVIALGLLIYLSASDVRAQETITTPISAQDGGAMVGAAELSDAGDGTTRIVVTLRSQPAGVTQPVFIHEGPCANVNPAPKYPLTALMNGRSETIVMVPLTALTAVTHSINLYQLVAEGPAIAACGDIVEEARGEMPTTAPRAGGGGMMALPAPPLPWLVGVALLGLVFVVRLGKQLLHPDAAP